MRSSLCERGGGKEEEERLMAAGHLHQTRLTPRSWALVSETQSAWSLKPECSAAPVTGDPKPCTGRKGRLAVAAAEIGLSLREPPSIAPRAV